MYEVTYVDDCQQVTQTQCRLFSNFLCDEVRRTECTKVPRLAREKCRQVPRNVEVCREISVRRPAGKCRAQCGGQRSASCGPGGADKCREVTTTREVERNKEICDTTPVKKCKTEKVKRLKLIPKKICTELKQTEEQKQLLLKVKDKEKPKAP